MDHLRKRGAAPFIMVVVHGEPGAGGEIAPEAKDNFYGILNGELLEA